MQFNRSSILSMRAANMISRRVVASSRSQVARFSSQMEIDDDFENGRPTGKLSPDQYRKEHQISLKSASGNHDFPPMTEFDQTPFSPELKRILASEGFTGPTPTQAQSWPIALKQRDIISVARTGSGKTCGFLLPAFHKLALEKSLGIVQRSEYSDNPYARGAPIRTPSVLVLAPTRELTVQIESEAQKFCRSGNFSSVW
jgi:ATP-dependent RNA helicase DDX5/DBP2